MTVAPNSKQSATAHLHHFGNHVASGAHIFVLGLILKFSCALSSQRPDYSPRFGMSRGAMISLVTTQTSLRQGQEKVRDAERCTWQGQSTLYCSKLEAVARPKKLTDSFTRSTVGLTLPVSTGLFGLVHPHPLHFILDLILSSFTLEICCDLALGFLLLFSVSHTVPCDINYSASVVMRHMNLSGTPCRHTSPWVFSPV